MIVIFHDTFFLSLREMTVALNSYVIYLLYLDVYIYMLVFSMIDWQYMCKRSIRDVTVTKEISLISDIMQPSR